MGTFDSNRAALSEAYEEGESRIAAMLDGQVVAPRPRPVPVQAAKPEPPPAAEGPGFWSRIGSGIADTVKQLGEVRVEILQPISGAQSNAAAQLAPPRREPPWGLWIGLAAAGVVALALLTKR